MSQLTDASWPVPFPGPPNPATADAEDGATLRMNACVAVQCAGFPTKTSGLNAVPLPADPTATQEMLEVQATFPIPPSEPVAAFSVTCFAEDDFQDKGLPTRTSGSWKNPSKPTATQAVADEQVTEMSAPCK